MKKLFKFKFTRLIALFCLVFASQVETVKGQEYSLQVQKAAEGLKDIYQKGGSIELKKGIDLVKLTNNLRILQDAGPSNRPRWIFDRALEAYHTRVYYAIKEAKTPAELGEMFELYKSAPKLFNKHFTKAIEEKIAELKKQTPESDSAGYAILQQISDEFTALTPKKKGKLGQESAKTQAKLPTKEELKKLIENAYTPENRIKCITSYLKASPELKALFESRMIEIATNLMRSADLYARQTNPTDFSWDKYKKMLESINSFLKEMIENAENLDDLVTLKANYFDTFSSNTSFNQLLKDRALALANDKGTTVVEAEALTAFSHDVGHNVDSIKTLRDRFLNLEKSLNTALVMIKSGVANEYVYHSILEHLGRLKVLEVESRHVAADYSFKSMVVKLYRQVFTTFLRYKARGTKGLEMDLAIMMGTAKTIDEANRCLTEFLTDPVRFENFGAGLERTVAKILAENKGKMNPDFITTVTKFADNRIDNAKDLVTLTEISKFLELSLGDLPDVQRLTSKLLDKIDKLKEDYYDTSSTFQKLAELKEAIEEAQLENVRRREAIENAGLSDKLIAAKEAVASAEKVFNAAEIKLTNARERDRIAKERLTQAEEEAKAAGKGSTVEEGRARAEESTAENLAAQAEEEHTAAAAELLAKREALKKAEQEEQDETGEEDGI